MSNINKAAVLNPFSDLTSNTLDYVPRATTSEFGIVAIGSGINVDNLGRIYLDTQEYSDRLTAIEAQAASSLDTQKSEVAAAIAQVNLTQSQTITALSLEVSNLKTDLTNSITATQTDLINRADELAQDVTDITQQLTQDKATFTQEIQDALDYLQDEASVASALRTPRKIQGVDFDGTQDISLPIFSTQIDGLVPKRVGATTTNYLCEDGTWAVPADTTYALLTKASAEDGTATTANTISAQVLKEAIQYHAPTVTNIVGNAATATKLQTPRSIAISGAVTGTATSFDGSANIVIATTAIDGSKISTGTIPAARIPTLDQSTTGNAGSATKLATGRTINGVAFDGTANIIIPFETPTATETTAGKAKIATTAIAQAGVNDTDIMTPKKVKDQVSMGGRIHANAYISTVGGVNTILSSKNILSIVRTSNGVQKVTTATNMDNINFTIQTTGAAQPGVSPIQGYLIAERLNVSNLPIRTLSSFELVMSNGSDLIDSFRWGVTVIC